MSDNKSNVVSFADFKAKHPKPSGKLYRDPKSKSRLAKVQEDNRHVQKSRDSLNEAMRRYGDASGNVARNKAEKLKKEREELLKEYDLGEIDGNI
jgi:hypothetical protein